MPKVRLVVKGFVETLKYGILKTPELVQNKSFACDSIHYCSEKIVY